MPQGVALSFLIAVTPVCGWVIFSDLKHMKIRNTAVITLVAIFILGGAVVLPIGIWAERLAQAGIVLACGFALHLAAGIGAGDVKFAAAAAPYISATPGSLHLLLLLMMAITLAALITHRSARALPTVRRLAPDWISWSRADFPFGIVLAATLWSYLAVSAVAG